MIVTTRYGLNVILGLLSGTQDKPGLVQDEEQDMKAVVSPLVKIVRKIEEERQDTQKLTQSLIDRNLEEGESPQDEAVIERLEEDEDFNEAYRDLMNEEVKVDAPKIDPEALVGVSAATVLKLSPIMKGLEE